MLRRLRRVVPLLAIAVALAAVVDSPGVRGTPAPGMPPAALGHRTGAASSELVRVELTATGSVEEVLAVIDEIGGSVELRVRDRVQARVPADRIAELEALAPVRLEEPSIALPLQTTATALQRLGADRWHEAGFTGHGVRVAVIDTGFRGFRDALGRSLPPQVTTRSFTDSGIEGGTDHGLRAAELVHAVAPGAALYLVNFGTVTELAAAVDYVIEERVDVVSFSLGFIHNGPGDGTGPVNEIVSRATETGIAWAVAAGNWAQQHWSGVFTDRNDDSVHEFAPGESQNTHYFLAGDLIIVSLRWDDDWGAACSDYDLEIFGPDGSLVRASRRIQACHGNPVEGLQVLATQSGDYGVRIIRASSDRPRRLDLMVVGAPDRGERLRYAVPEGSISEPGDHPDVVTVGALDADELAQAPFSSRGPTRDQRSKPTVIAPTGLPTKETRGFAGTSAAAPHVAGVIALLREAFPAAGREAVASHLLVRSILVPGAGGLEAAVRIASLGSLSGLGELLPPGAAEASLIGATPSDGSLALASYSGPDGYPLRFVHLLTEGRDVAAAFRLDLRQGRFDVFHVGAPAWVNTLQRIDDGDILVLRLAVPPGETAQAATDR